MAQPTLSDVHVNTPLTVLSNMYLQEATGFIARVFFPIVPVTNISDRYYTYSRADFNRNQMRKRGLSTTVAKAGYRVDNQANYLCDVWALGRDIDDQLRGNADAVLNLDVEATRFLTMQSLINREISWVNTFFTTGVWTNNWTGSGTAPTGGYPTVPGTAFSPLVWSNSSSTPIQDVRALCRLVQVTTGLRPNCMAIGRVVYDTLVDHPDFLDRVKYGQTYPQPAQVTLAILAEIFDMDRVVVANAIENTASEFAATDSGAAYAPPNYNAGVNANESNQFIAGNHVLVAYVDRAPGIMTPGCGYTFAWTGYFGATQAGERISSYYWQPTRSTVVEIESAYAQKLVSADLGGFIANIV